jgi:hypothetical protein
MVKLYPTVKPDDAVKQVLGQVKGLLIDEIFANTSTDEARILCKAESDPAGTRWTSNGMPHVQQSLATLYDWLTRQQ